MASHPLYRRIAEDLVGRIQRGEFPPGALLPPEHALCRTHGVSRITVRKALEVLVDGHYVLRRRGVGTVVRPLDRDHWSVLLAAPLDEVLPPQRYVLVRQASVRPPPDLADFAGWAPEQRVRVFEATNHVATAEPLAHVQFYFPHPLAERIAGSLIEGPLPCAKLVERHFGRRIDHARQRYEAVTASAKSARHLRVPPGTALLRGLRVYVDDEGAPIYAIDACYHPQHYRLTARLTRQPPQRG